MFFLHPSVFKNQCKKTPDILQIPAGLEEEQGQSHLALHCRKSQKLCSLLQHLAQTKRQSWQMETNLPRYFLHAAECKYCIYLPPTLSDTTSLRVLCSGMQEREEEWEGKRARQMEISLWGQIYKGRWLPIRYMTNWICNLSSSVFQLCSLTVDI